ncbi:hypothetical protein [Candidatus Burkholderia verschuerenii]|nr:hypothetical protein [Candidatus Burkholderia verschuerenii]
MTMEGDAREKAITPPGRNGGIGRIGDGHILGTGRLDVNTQNWRILA